MDEINKLKTKELDSHMEAIRDLFIFGCYTGMAYSDIQRFRYDTDVVESDNRFFIEGKRKKNKYGILCNASCPYICAFTLHVSLFTFASLKIITQQQLELQ